MGGAIIKFPQIIKIIGRKSVLGISFFSVILEVLFTLIPAQLQYLSEWLLYL